MYREIVIFILLALVTLTSTRVLSQDIFKSTHVERAKAQVCLSQKGKPTEHCLETSGLTLRMGGTDREGSEEVDLAFWLNTDKIGDLAKFVSSQDGEKLQICVIDGANICPPKPLEIVAVCITTSELAGYECPEAADRRSDGGAFVNLRSGPNPAEVDCVEAGVDWCQASYEVTGGPLKKLINCIVAATKECVGSSTVIDALRVID